MIKSLLIANRGEIACRIIRTARELGIRTVAVYSDADAKALHVRQADEAVHIGPSPARESYLVGEKIIAAAKATGAEAIHPGYGFLSENADFAEQVIAAGLVWVGPKPDSIRAMGLKDAAKARMIAAGVPVTPGYLGEDQSPDRLKAEADAIGYPVLIKAVAGGGGKGMRRVDAAGDFLDALASCQREAASSFGDDRVLLEKYILSPRHIEVQVFGDSHGNVVHLFERDCSLQRRHQKVIEEAPAPGMDEKTREAICAAAVRAAQAVDYVGAGTIEFIADASEGLRADRIWFMEMNTRLQVEHPVTEEITGQDLVEWQLRVASGEELPKRQRELQIHGHAMEARLYAEDPTKGFLPSIGRLDDFLLPHAIRIETGVVQGGEVSSFYDPMIAKLVTHGLDRDEARSRLAEACKSVRVRPIKTNAEFMAHALEDPDFVAGTIDTGLIERKLDSLVERETPDAKLLSAGALLLLAHSGKPIAEQPILSSSGGREWVATASTRWNPLFGFRLNAAPQHKVRFAVDDEVLEIDLDATGPVEPYTYDHEDDGSWAQSEKGFAPHFFSFPASKGGGAGASAGNGAILAPMPGRVTAVEVAAGDTVTKGQRLVTLEAMKMEHGLTAPFDGTIAELNVAQGSQVSEGALLVKVEKAED
ncbi:acetyl/propionyl/methylcrotonyl-CoA carboxylase subunit alpha [Sphingomonas kyeonggiensis]|uniref:3-methylcrotonyl-CoA carboxylase alpha subunit n=1 Tax=Sphingomonas kyeonggiensis TaxID=1268553 RepID=A0A7W6JRB7_9SPHN|nr:acetyl/propionyl/methylcrotonyl-CoA carboxylase subunit alpha [Sphingomonas kyeonggiensis]MBB4098129.1 3-methylcrotonyl-CoA carboxylase alpha subunit [Sphingomonas kyeonggiensis]